jgi:hypothetical protein
MIKSPQEALPPIIIARKPNQFSFKDLCDHLKPMLFKTYKKSRESMVEKLLQLTTVSEFLSKVFSAINC